MSKSGGRPGWRYIVWHTAADPRDGGMRDTSASEIDSWHRANGWSKIGYHYVIRRDGRIENGRGLDEVGAHVRGLNSQAIGICFSGHGDLQPLTEKQLSSGLRLTKTLMKLYGIPVSNIIGHREVNKILPPKYHVSKTCPGKLVNMDNIRAMLGGGSKK